MLILALPLDEEAVLLQLIISPADTDTLAESSLQDEADATLHVKEVATLLTYNVILPVVEAYTYLTYSLSKVPAVGITAWIILLPEEEPVSLTPPTEL